MTESAGKVPAGLPVRSSGMGHFVFLFIAMLLAAGCEANPSATPTNSPPPTPAPTPAPTARPTGSFSLSAQPLNTVLRLSWTAVPNAHSYNVYRDGGKMPLNASALTATSFDDLGLTNDRTYTDTVAALDASGTSLTRSPELRIAPKAL